MKTLIEILEGKSIKLSQAYNRLAGMDPKQKLGFYDEYSDPKKEYTVETFRNDLRGVIDIVGDVDINEITHKEAKKYLIDLMNK